MAVLDGSANRFFVATYNPYAKQLRFRLRGFLPRFLGNDRPGHVGDDHGTKIRVSVPTIAVRTQECVIRTLGGVEVVVYLTAFVEGSGSPPNTGQKKLVFHLKIPLFLPVLPGI